MKKKINKDWKLSKQTGRDIHSGVFIEAICPHGVGHHKGIHGCHEGDTEVGESCCVSCPPELWKMVTEDK